MYNIKDEEILKLSNIILLKGKYESLENCILADNRGERSYPGVDELEKIINRPRCRRFGMLNHIKYLIDIDALLIL